MNKLFSICFLFFFICFNAQNIAFPEHLQKTFISKLQTGDSLLYYQCHVDEAIQELTLSSGQKIISKKKRITITEKFSIYKKDSVYICNYFISSFNNYPNKKFPYLTLTEVENWDFELKQTKQLNIQDLLVIATLETKSHAIVHMELNINKTCPNQIIICTKKDKEQFLVEGNYFLSKSLHL